MLVTWISPWDMSIMSVLIQCKSSLNQGLTDKLKGWNPMAGGKNGPAKSFPTPLLRRNMQLSKCFLNVNFSLGQDNHECSDTVQE